MSLQKDHRFARIALMGGASVAYAMCLLSPTAATAQEAAAPAEQQSAAQPQTQAPAPQDGDEITVTGSRVVRDGYEAPSPTSVIGEEEIASKAPANLAEFVNEMPSLSASVTPRGYTSGVSNGTVGINALNLRALGAARTLVLLDRRRVAPSTLSGLIDINTIPQAVVKRVDIVTGGASASWGSDAVGGVVNFILDKDFQGIKGLVQGGVTDYGDGRNYNLSLTAGTKFAGDRGHIMVSAELAHSDGIQGLGNRKWYNGAKIFNNPAWTATNGQPRLLALPNVGFTNAAPGGIITTGPLAGTYFGPGGTPAQQVRGGNVGGGFFTGGDWRYFDFGSQVDLEPRMNRTSIFGYGSFEIGENIEVYAEGSYVRATGGGVSSPAFDLGTFTIQPDNAFIPASIAGQVTAPFSLGTLNSDLPPTSYETDRSSLRGVIGFRGRFDALGTPWQWDVSAQKTRNRVYSAGNVTITSRLNQAADAVRNAQGVIVCRSTLTNPTNGCVPYNLFGVGVNTEAPANWIVGTSWLRSTLTQEVYAATLNGDPFSTWAGPVSIAVGAEHRREAVSGETDPLSPTRAFRAGNYIAASGSYHVTEAFLETVIPLAKDSPFADKLDLSAAVRATDYSTSGYVTTWKVGLTYSPVPDITFRATRSRDIRAPNLAELFQAGNASTSNITDPARNNALSSVFGVTTGSTSLQPEKADTLGLGVVFQPTFLPGFQASVDYYHVDVKDSIATLVSQTIVNQCFQGNTQFCGQITRAATGPLINGLTPITTVSIQPVNIANVVSKGLDFEASYRQQVFGGGINLRVMATRFLKATTNDGIVPQTELVGTNHTLGSLRSPLPKWRYTASIGFDYEPVSLNLIARGFSAGKINNSYVECTSGCPVSTTANTTINYNRMPGEIYFDANIAVKVSSKAEAFLAVDNIANTDPYQMPYGPSIGSSPLSANPILYDVAGRSFRAGIRFKL